MNQIRRLGFFTARERSVLIKEAKTTEIIATRKNQMNLEGSFIIQNKSDILAEKNPKINIEKKFPFQSEKVKGKVFK